MRRRDESVSNRNINLNKRSQNHTIFNSGSTNPCDE